MAVGWAIVLIAATGLLGGLLNALLADEGLIPRVDTLADGRKIWRPGFVGYAFVGGITALVLMALYSPLGSIRLGSVHASGATYDLTLAELAGAFLSALGAARLLTLEVRRQYDQASQKQAKAVSGSLAMLANDRQTVAPERNR